MAELPSLEDVSAALFKELQENKEIQKKMPDFSPSWLESHLINPPLLKAVLKLYAQGVALVEKKWDYRLLFDKLCSKDSPVASSYDVVEPLQQEADQTYGRLVHYAAVAAYHNQQEKAKQSNCRVHLVFN